MRFEARVFTLAKDVQCADDYQDAFRMDSARGIAAIADGVSSAIFSGPWAAMLVEAVVADTPDPADPEAFARWLRELRAAWSQQIDVSNLTWFQKAKLQQGAFSTLLWIVLTPSNESTLEPATAYRLRAVAVGDSNLFHMRAGALLQTFPLQTAEEFDVDPIVLGSIDHHHDELVKFAMLDDSCQAGDLLVLCTDAIAAWALRRQASGDPPAWEHYWDLAAEAWQTEILDLRQQREMRCDDATLLLLRVKEEEPAAKAALETALQSDTTATAEATGERFEQSLSLAPESSPERGEGTPAPKLPPATDERNLATSLPSASDQGSLETAFEREAAVPPEEESPLPWWAETIANVSEEVTGQLTGQMRRAVRKMKEIWLRKQP